MRTNLANFQCQRCGACCRAPGYVTLEQGEAESIAACLGIDVYDFTQRFTRLTYSRDALSLIEQESGHCIFLLPDNTCRVQSAKPLQCQGYPQVWRSPTLDNVCAGFAAIRQRNCHP